MYEVYTSLLENLPPSPKFDCCEFALRIRTLGARLRINATARLYLSLVVARRAKTGCWLHSSRCSHVRSVHFARPSLKIDRCELILRIITLALAVMLLQVRSSEV
jgi:hypothetical protein